MSNGLARCDLNTLGIRKDSHMPIDLETLSSIYEKNR